MSATATPPAALPVERSLPPRELRSLVGGRRRIAFLSTAHPKEDPV